MAQMGNYPLLKAIENVVDNINIDNENSFGELIESLSSVNENLSGITSQPIKSMQRGFIPCTTVYKCLDSNEKLLQTGYYDLCFDLTIAPVDTSKTLILLSQSTVTKMARLINSTTVRIYGQPSSNIGETSTQQGLYWYVIEFN